MKNLEILRVFFIASWVSSHFLLIANNCNKVRTGKVGEYHFQ
jgi:hypothetical protein